MLTAYRAGAGAPVPAAELTAQVADAVAVTLLYDLDVSRDLGTSRAEVHQATGFLVARHGLSADDALALLRARAYADGVALREIARLVLDRAVDLVG